MVVAVVVVGRLGLSAMLPALLTGVVDLPLDPALPAAGDPATGFGLEICFDFDRDGFAGGVNVGAITFSSRTSSDGLVAGMFMSVVVKWAKSSGFDVVFAVVVEVVVPLDVGSGVVSSGMRMGEVEDGVAVPFAP